jgi:hypothetical protein
MFRPTKWSSSGLHQNMPSVAVYVLVYEYTHMQWDELKTLLFLDTVATGQIA